MYFYPYKRGCINSLSKTPDKENTAEEYGGRFNRTGCILYLSEKKATQILLPGTLPGLDLYEIPNAILIPQNGVYTISSSLFCYTPGRAVIAAGIRVNGKTARESGLIRTFTPNEPQTIQHSILLTLVQGDVVDLAVTGNTPVTLALAPGNAASLTILYTSDK